MAYLRGSINPPVAPVPYTPWGRITHLFHGWDGSVWDMTDGRDGVFLMPEGIEGMGMPTIENYTFSSPVVHGIEWEGWRASGRDVHWVVGIFEDSSSEWIEMKTAFWKIFRPGKTLRWEIILPNNVSYNLTVRFKTDHTSVYSRDPVKLGWAIYGITCFTEDPFWEGTLQQAVWYPGSQTSFLGASGLGPPFIITPGTSIQNARITNPGDVEAYLKWELKGPFQSASVGIDGLVTNLGSATADDTFLLDTDPRTLTATKNGEDVMASLGAFEYAPIPPGEDITLQLAMDGTGLIRASFVPLYFRSV